MIYLSRTDFACRSCREPFEPLDRPIYLVDIPFHDHCTPTCRSCGTAVAEHDQGDWRYSASVVSDRSGYHLEPADYWCGQCWEISGRDDAFGQD